MSTVFSENQVRQLYIAKSFVAADSFTKASALGAVTVTADADGHIYLKHIGYGGMTHSDLIDPKLILWAKAVAPKKSKLKKVTVELDSTVNGGLPIAGEDYILRVNFRGLYGPSDADIYQKYGAVRAFKNMTAAQFYAMMAYSLVKNLSREHFDAIEVSLDGGTTAIAQASMKAGAPVFYDEAGATIDAASAASITLTEKSAEKSFKLGVHDVSGLSFDVVPTTVFDGTLDMVWGTVANEQIDGLVNGYDIANLEYFTMKARADKYGMINWPDNIDTKYLADPTKEYYTIEIHFAYVGANHAVQKSEKTLTVAFESMAEANKMVAAVNALCAGTLETLA